MAWDINGISGEYTAEWQGTFKGAKPTEVALQDCEEQREPNLRHQISSWREPLPELCLGLISKTSGWSSPNQTGSKLTTRQGFTDIYLSMQMHPDKMLKAWDIM